MQVIKHSQAVHRVRTAAAHASHPAVACRACGQRIPGIPPGASLAYNTPAAHAAWQGNEGSRGTAVPIAPAWDEVHAEGKSRAPHASITACAAATAATTSASAAPVAAVVATPVPPSATPATPTGPAALLRAIALRGSQSALASAIGVSQSHVWHWLARLRVPAEHCPAIERATQRAVRCEELRPDIDWGYLRALCEPVHEIARAASHATGHDVAHQVTQAPAPAAKDTKDTRPRIA